MIASVCALCVLIATALAQTISLPPGIQVEGVAHAAGSLFFATQFRQGGVLLVDTDTGFFSTVVAPAFDRQAAGMAFRNGSLYVAGLGILGTFRGPPRMFVHDVLTGDTVRACDAPFGALVNDVVVDDQFAYFTDTLLGNIYALPVDSEKCEFETIELPRDSFPEGGGAFSANGIVKFGSGLIVANTGVGSLFFVDLETRETEQLLPDGTVTGSDGMEIVVEGADGTEATLYVVQNVLDMISVWRVTVDEGRVSLQFERNVTSSLFELPTTLAIGGGTLLVANGAFERFPLTEELPEDAQFELVAFRVGGGKCSL